MYRLLVLFLVLLVLGCNDKSNKPFEETEAIVEEFRIDYNRDHFIRDKEFTASWDTFDEETRQIFIEFLERSCTAEFSGFLIL